MPAPGPGVCPVCRGPSAGVHSVCFVCRLVAGRLGLPLAPVLPARFCPIPSALYGVLLGYKESAVAEERRHLGATVLALCSQHLVDAAAELRAAAGGAIDVVLLVPSTVRAGPPLAQLGGLEGAVHDALPGAAWAPTVLDRDPRAGSRLPRHMAPAARGFVVRGGGGRPAVRDRRALVLDDLYVSGSRAQSAAAALRLAGARSVVLAPLGRVLRPDRVRAHRVFLERQANAVG